VWTYAKGGVDAAGIISAGPISTGAACVGIILSGRKCYYGLLFPIMTGTATSIEDDLNMTVNTP
jgi:hypothetical protein